MESGTAGTGVAWRHRCILVSPVLVIPQINVHERALDLYTIIAFGAWRPL